MFLTRKTKLAVTAVACGVPLTGTAVMAADRAIPDHETNVIDTQSQVEIRASKASDLVSKEADTDDPDRALENSLKQLLEEERTARSSGVLPPTRPATDPADSLTTADSKKPDSTPSVKSTTTTPSTNTTSTTTQPPTTVSSTTAPTTKPPTTASTTTQPSRDAAYQAFWDAGYSFDQLITLSNEWGVSQFDAKVRAGRAILAGNRSSFESILDRHRAYDAWLDAGYNFEEVQILADAWNISYFDAKARAGRAILAGDRSLFQPILDEVSNL